MELGASGANMARALAPVELEFASGRVSAATQREWKKRQLHDLILREIMNQ